MGSPLDGPCHFGRRAIVLALTSLLGAVTARATEPCFSPAGLLGGLSIPGDGTAVAPSNVTPIVDGGALEIRLVGPGGDEPIAIEDLFIDGGLSRATLRRLVPRGPLSEGQSYTIIVDGQVRSSFTVGAGLDLIAPAPPDASFTGGADSCGAAFVGVASEDAAFFIGAVNGQPVIGANVSLNGLAAAGAGNLVLFGTGSAVVNVAAVDLAGNVSASVPVEVVVDELGLSCAAGGAGAASGLGALALLALASRARAPLSARRR
jgi:hypothetical protein